MNQSENETAVRGISIINLILGAWLIMSPYLLGYTTAQSMWNQTLVGVVVAVFAAWRLVDLSARWASWLNVVAAIWLVIAPFALGYEATVAYWNEIITAAVLLILELGNANVKIETHTHHHAF